MEAVAGRRLHGLSSGRRFLFAAALVIASTIPLWIPAIPPFIDVPGHIGAYHLALNLRGIPSLQAYYSFAWHLIGNLGGELGVFALGPLLGVELATKVVVIASIALQAAGMLFIAREVHGRIPGSALFALPFAYCFPLYFGFVNYCLGMGFALLGFGGWLWLERRRRLILRALLLLAFAPFVWVTHAIAWVMLCLMCGGAEVWRIWATDPRNPRLYLGSALRLLPLLAPVVIILAAPGGAPSDMAGFFPLKTLPITIAATLRDRWRNFDLLSLAIPLVLIGLALVGRWRLRMQPMLAVVAAVLFLFFLVTPNAINGSSWLQQRVIPYAIVLAILAVAPRDGDPRADRGLMIVGLGFFTMRIAGVTLSCLFYAQEWASYLAVIDSLPVGARVLNLAVDDCESPRWYRPRTEHLSGVALERRNAFVNDQWTLNGIQLVTVHYPAAEPFTAEPSEHVRFDRCPQFSGLTQPQALATFPRAAFDYVWLLNTRAADRPSDAGLRLISSSERGALYRIVRSGF